MTTAERLARSRWRSWWVPASPSPASWPPTVLSRAELELITWKFAGSGSSEHSRERVGNGAWGKHVLHPRSFPPSLCCPFSRGTSVQTLHSLCFHACDPKYCATCNVPAISTKTIVDSQIHKTTSSHLMHMEAHTGALPNLPYLSRQMYLPPASNAHHDTW